MPKISKIEVQKRPGRYNIYLDDKYAFPVAESVVIKFRLVKGMEIDDEQIKEITTADQQAQAYSKILDYLSYQMRSESEVLKKLKDLETPEEFVPPIMAKLREQRLVDDRQYAIAFVRTMVATSLKGPGVIRQQLRLKKVGENDIEAALEEFSEDDIREHASKLATKLFKRYAKQPTFMQEQKVRQGLMTKGYGGDVFEQIKYDVVPEEDPEQQEDLLKEQAEKIWHRYRRYAGMDRQRRFKQAMFRKGFDLDAVQHWLEENDESLS
ncbi:MAG: recombination regulator RecX [Limosilactobacillus sp.]|uniref:recombination regulator RecX n=1 Tax=Limosilactobacillus sp. TaxID=2773925 RepID=UPI00270DEA68|nr:recombination regulator RecX [Limosilactobacillus sp.]